MKNAIMKNMIEYKGYYGRVEYSAEDSCFCGLIFGISDVISFEGQTVEELKEAFCDAVDDYMLLCEEAGKEPQKPYKGSFNVRVTPKIHERAALIASSLDISLNQYVERALADEIARDEKKYLALVIG